MRNEHSGLKNDCPNESGEAQHTNGGTEPADGSSDQNVSPRSNAAERTKGCAGADPSQLNRSSSSDEKPAVRTSGGALIDASVHETRTKIQPIANSTTKFQDKILTILSVKPFYGLAIKRRLEEYYQEQVNHGRLYPNLDQLCEQGLVEKRELDKRTNQYSLTDLGEQVVEFDHEWDAQRIDGEDVEVTG